MTILPQNKTVLVGYFYPGFDHPQFPTNNYCILTVDFAWEWLAENQKYLDSVRFKHRGTTVGGSDYKDHIQEVLADNHLAIGDKKNTTSM